MMFDLLRYLRGRISDFREPYQSRTALGDEIFCWFHGTRRLTCVRWIKGGYCIIPNYRPNLLNILPTFKSAQQYSDEEAPDVVYQAYKNLFDNNG
jgi:hypothetical protein